MTTILLPREPTPQYAAPAKEAAAARAIEEGSRKTRTTSMTQHPPSSNSPNLRRGSY